MRTHLHRAMLALTAVALVGLAACGGSSGQQGEGGLPDRVITVDGSSTVFPITEAVAEEFQRENRGTRVTVGISGTGGGFQKFCNGEIDIADASRPVSPTEIERCAGRGVRFIELPVAYDGITIVVHPNNTWATSMTVAELRRLWEPAAQNTVTRWSQVREGWPDREIHLFGAGVDSGTYDYFTEVIVGKAKASRGDYTSSEDDNMLVQGISGDELALGFLGLAYFEENRQRLRAVPIDDENRSNGDGPILPSSETIRKGTYQPLSRPVFIYVNPDRLSRPEVAAFVDFYFSVGADLVRDVGYVPLTDREYQLAQARLQNRTEGSMFGGGRAAGTSLETLLGGPARAQ